jgi:hypothetical protein
LYTCLRLLPFPLDVATHFLFRIGSLAPMRRGGSLQCGPRATTSISGGGWNSPGYDAAGNIASGPKAGAETTRLHFVYDAWNRLVQVKADNAGQPGEVIATYQYDGRGFCTQEGRILMTVRLGGEQFPSWLNLLGP